MLCVDTAPVLGKLVMRHPFVAFPTVDKTRVTIREQKEVTVQLINYTKSGKKFWNLFYLQPMWVQKVAKCY